MRPSGRVAAPRGNTEQTLLPSQLEALTEGRKVGLDTASPLGLCLPEGYQQGQVSRAERLWETPGEAGRKREPELARPTPACLRRADLGPRSGRRCLCRYLMVVVSLVLLGSFLQERLEEHLMYSLLVVSPPGGAPTTGRSFSGEFSQFRRHPILTVRALRRKLWKDQERVRDRISAEPALTQSRGKGEEEGRAFTCAGAARTRPPGGPPGGHIPEPRRNPPAAGTAAPGGVRVPPGPRPVLEPTLF